MKEKKKGVLLRKEENGEAAVFRILEIAEDKYNSFNHQNPFR